jgi:hypothetical protein
MLQNLANLYDNADAATAERSARLERRLALAQARDQYERARRQAQWGRVRNLLARVLGLRPRQLLALQTAQSVNRRYGGLQTVALERIRGSEGRLADFDADFNPLRPSTAQRWISVAAERAVGHTLPPVELIQVGDLYYVRDGHHRVSVAHVRGERFIEAQVMG